MRFGGVCFSWFPPHCQKDQSKNVFSGCGMQFLDYAQFWAITPCAASIST